MLTPKAPQPNDAVEEEVISLPVIALRPGDLIYGHFVDDSSDWAILKTLYIKSGKIYPIFYRSGSTDSSLVDLELPIELPVRRHVPSLPWRHLINLVPNSIYQASEIWLIKFGVSVKNKVGGEWVLDDPAYLNNLTEKDYEFLCIKNQDVIDNQHLFE